MLTSTYVIPSLPPRVDLETPDVLRALALASRVLAELKGRAATIPNQGILIDMLALQEAKASSEIENIVTTQDELFQADLSAESMHAGPTKEVALYRDALKLGFDRLRTTDGLITNNLLIAMFQRLKGRMDAFRATPGTVLRNDISGQIIYVPPQDHSEILQHMAALERFINLDDAADLDPLIKMAVIHHQFQSIHPFPDGNGRVGRILNVLYLARTGLLDIPILYLSRHITRTKPDYYRLLQRVRDEQGSADAWRDWTLYMLAAVTETAKATLTLVEGIGDQMRRTKHRMRREFPNLYSQDLLNNLFRHPYTRIDFVMQELHVTRQTAAKYLDQLAAAGFVRKHTAGRNNYYINEELVALFLSVSGGR